MVLAYGLKDLGFRGNAWANNRQGQAYIAARLDRAFSIASWLDNYADPIPTHLRRLSSEKSLLLLSRRNRFSSKKVHFKFEAMWLSHNSFFEVEETSRATQCIGTPKFVPGQKLKLLKLNLKV